MQPAISKHLCGSLRLIPISHHHAIAASDNLADSMSVVRYIVSVRIDNAQFASGNGIASHCLTAVALFALPVASCFGKSNRERGRCFCESISCIAGAAQIFFYFLNQAWGGSRATDGDALKTAEIVFAAFWRIDERDGDCWHKRHPCDAFLLNQAKQFAAIPALDHHMFAADKRDRMSRSPAVRMK